MEGGIHEMATKKTTRKKTAKATRKKATSKRVTARKAASKKGTRKRSSQAAVSRKKSARGPSRRVSAPAKRQSSGSLSPSREKASGSWKTRGSSASRRIIRQIAKRILKEAEGRTREEAASLTGALVSDIKNLKAGNLPSLKLFLRVVRDGGFDPDALIHDNELRRLPPRTSTRNARSKLISDRVHKLAKSYDPAELSKTTGLSIYTIYQHRVADKRVGLHTLIALVISGVVTAREIFLGQTSR